MSEKNEILFVSSYPPRECGIATYSQDLFNAISKKFGNTFSLKVCALENKDYKNNYPGEVKYILQTSEYSQYVEMAKKINSDKHIKLIFVQHEFGLFEGEYGGHLLYFLHTLQKPVVLAFHTVLPNPCERRKQMVKSLANYSKNIIVMTNNSKDILEHDYNVSPGKIAVIYHGTHLVSGIDKNRIREKYKLEAKNILSTFGLLSSGKCIETALDALPHIVEKFPDTIYCIVGITHPGVVKKEGEQYREFLEKRTIELGVEKNVRFINKYLSLEELLEFLRITDIYFFTSKDPNQAVSGTLSYAMGCSCPVISTPIPHAKEMLKDDAGIIVDFQNHQQLSLAAINLLADPGLRRRIKLNALHKIHPTSWHNSAIAHAELFTKSTGLHFQLQYNIPEISLQHINRLTTNSGIIQFADIIEPDLKSGYTLDDNARALIALVRYFEIKKDVTVFPTIEIYLTFIEFMQQADGGFLNYMDENGNFHSKNREVNLEDATGRAIWALGEFIASGKHFYIQNSIRAERMLRKTLNLIQNLKSPRAIAFSIKGLYYYNQIKRSAEINEIIKNLADDLVSKYHLVSNEKWKWFEDYLTYANSVLPEALLCAYLSTGKIQYKTIAKSTFDFLLELIYVDKKIKVVSNNGWHNRGEVANKFGEQPIDVAYTILSLDLFYKKFGDPGYLHRMEAAFSWFHGNNHLKRIIYNPVTGGCQDGLEEYTVNLNQGAESTICYLLSRLVMEKYRNKLFAKKSDNINEPVVSKYKVKIAPVKLSKEPVYVFQMFL